MVMFITATLMLAPLNMSVAINELDGSDTVEVEDSIATDWMALNQRVHQSASSTDTNSNLRFDIGSSILVMSIPLILQNSLHAHLLLALETHLCK